VSKAFGASPKTERAIPSYITADPKNDRFAYCAVDHIVIRKISDPHQYTVYRGHPEPTCVRFSPDGAVAASGDMYGFLKVWNTANPAITRYEGQMLAGPLRDIAWSPDSQRLLIVGEGKGEHALVIMADGGSRIGKLDGFLQGCISCDFRPNDRPFKMMAICNDRTTAFWKGPPLKKEWQREEMDILARQVRYSPDGSMIASVGGGKILIYDGVTGERKTEFATGEHKGTVLGVGWSEDCKSLITASCDQTVKMWDVESCTVKTTFTFGEDSMQFQQLGCVWAGEKLISIGLNGDLYFLDEENPGEPALVLPGLSGPCQGLVYSAETSTLYASATADSQCRVVSYSPAGTALARVAGATGPVQSITAMAACGGTDILTLSMDGSLNIADGADPAVASHVQKVLGFSLPTKGMAAGKDLAICLTATSICLLRKSGKYAIENELEGLAFEPCAVAISPDESEIAVSAEEERGVGQKKIELYKVEGANITHFKTIKGHRGVVYALEYSPDGTYLAAGDANREVRVYDRTKDYECLREDLQWHASRITSLAWHPDCDMLISGGLDKTLVVTHLKKMLKPTIVERITNGPIHNVTFLNADAIAVGDATGTITLLDFKKL